MNKITRKLGPLLVVLILVVGHTAHSQDYYESTYQYKRVSLGITFSPTASWLRYGDDETSESKHKFGFGYGLLADFAISENYYFSTGLIVNQLNHQSTQQFIGAGPRTIDYRIQYAEVPISLKLKSTQRYFRSYYGQFGFTTGFKLNAKESVDGGSRTSIGDEANFLRLALLIGGGVEWQLDHNMVMMTGLSFNNGFTQALKPGEPRNSYVAFNFGIFF